ncbi:hydantoinase/oxoprolinase family protein [Fredinandcohnia sp. QZ13]|uniref:hydantoinase/oxoprolinase family protein n=1 Tax=Fredinandcohnia sp. QZ13 TaxID=3073144 RepID=UPI0028536369|nr:hydantoinase/oxoprolinase family protein [Fredinandcohnia sp. QZ13]MDR4887340.1 hydantoinase/oxoprolinase family protein [Fredinandcohnia sp. QZ13]
MAQYTVDIDTGGTFTDGFFSYGDRFEVVKVETTPHDLTVCFNNCITEGAKRFGHENVSDFLKDTKTIRLSTTVGTNSIIQRTGPKLGLIVTRGYEDSLYQEGKNPILNFLIQEDLIVSIDEEVSEGGEVLKSVDEVEIRRVTKKLLELGTRVIVVSLKNAHANNQNEKLVRKIIQEDFPKHYLGTKPIQLGSDISSRSDNGVRTNAAVVNAYLHRDMVKYLYKADEGLRQKGYTKPLLIAHANGGVARVAKTKALDTYNSGPAAGLMGTRYIGEMYGLDNIMSVDVGGTSTDVGLISNGELTFDTESSIAEIPVHAPLIHVLSVGGGGGTIAKVTPNGELQLGPESAGAVPGPACFGLGGIKPTVTDACVVLGIVDPDYFLGGTKKISMEKAIEAIQKWIATPLNISNEEAAALIVDKIEQIGADTLKQLSNERGKNIKDFQLFSFGGGGGLFSAGMAKKSGISKIFTFPFSSVFSAFGLSTADISHTYQERVDFQFGPQEEIGEFLINANVSIENMKKLSHRDMRGEGFSPESIRYEVSIEVASNDEKVRDIFFLPSDVFHSTNEQYLREELQSISKQLGSDKIVIEFIRLNSYVSASHFALPSLELVNFIPEPKSIRPIYWKGNVINTNIYDIEELKPNHKIDGPAVLESSNTTIVVPLGAKFRMDQHLNGIMEV